MTERIKDWIARNVAQIVLTTFLVTGAWFALKAEVSLKADKAVVEQMAQDVRDIKAMVCRSYPNDSACLRGVR
jgi:hypothetical protein